VRNRISLILLAGLFLSGCGLNSNSNDAEVEFSNPVEEYRTEAMIYGLDENNLLIGNSDGFSVVDLVSKKVLTEIKISEKLNVKPADISGDIVVWADTRNKKEDITLLGENYSNSDIFICNIKTGEEKQITYDASAQMSPKIWRNYIIYSDNRNDTVKDYYGRWSLYLYDLNTSKEKLITSTLATNKSYSYGIKDNKIVWEDHRNFTGEDILRGGSNVPENNKDIYMYDITTDKEIAIATGDKMECSPDVYGDYIVYEDRNNGSYNADIILFNIKSKKKLYITKDKYDQGTPKIFGDYVAWMDERRGSSTNDVVDNGVFPNSDIIIYNIKTKKKLLIDRDEPQMMPYLSSEWLVFSTSRQIGGFSEAVRYK
jgi:beta propeller repeat protein